MGWFSVSGTSLGNTWPYTSEVLHNWITGFDGQSLAGRKDAEWKVKKDGGTFDYVAGATITPRAVIKAVHKTLRYAERHHDELFSSTAPAVKKEAK